MTPTDASACLRAPLDTGDTCVLKSRSSNRMRKAGRRANAYPANATELKERPVTVKVYLSPEQLHIPIAMPDAREGMDLGVAEELAVQHARWSYPVPLSDGEAQQRASDLEALARYARRAARR